MGCPQDVEWAIDRDLPEGDNVVTLQSRPGNGLEPEGTVARQDLTRSASRACSARCSRRSGQAIAAHDRSIATTTAEETNDDASEISQSLRPQGPAGRGGLEAPVSVLSASSRTICAQKEDGKFWFCDSQHWPTPFKPFDTVTVEFAVKCLGQYNTRHYLIPPANGVDYRIHNGYCYMSPVAVAPEHIAARVPQFLERAGYYFQNWDKLLDNWDKKVRANIADTGSAAGSRSCPTSFRSTGSRTASASTIPMP